jgi:hypothetical protein
MQNVAQYRLTISHMVPAVLVGTREQEMITPHHLKLVGGESQVIEQSQHPRYIHHAIIVRENHAEIAPALDLQVPPGGTNCIEGLCQRTLGRFLEDA